MKSYTKPTFNTTYLQNEDIITTSGLKAKSATGSGLKTISNASIIGLNK